MSLSSEHFLTFAYISCSTASEREGDEINENKTILSVAVAAFTLSIRTKLQFQVAILVP